MNHASDAFHTKSDKTKKFYPTSKRIFVISCDIFDVQLAHYLSSYIFLQWAGLAGAAGLYAVRSAVVESRCAAEAASPKTPCAREQLRKAGPATPSPALVSPPAI